MRRRLRRWALLLALVLGSIVGLDQWLFHRGEPHAVGQQSEPRRGRQKAEKQAVVGPFSSRAACEAALRTRAAGEPPGPRGPRVGTWNVRWFPRGTAEGKEPAGRTDVAWLACAIALLEVDLLALQEILSDLDGRRAALDLTAQLDALTGGRHRIELDDCAPGGRQHVGLLWNERRVELRGLHTFAAINPTGTMCGSSLRPGLGAHARFVDGTDLHVIALHLDSGRTERDFGNRTRSTAALVEIARELAASDRDLLALGDYNAMGCASCSPAVSASEELARLDRRLQGAGFERLVHAAGNRCSHYYRGRPGLLDFAAASASLAPRVRGVRAAGLCEALSCRGSKVGESPAAWRSLSDHCPVIVELKPGA